MFGHNRVLVVFRKRKADVVVGSRCFDVFADCYDVKALAVLRNTEIRGIQNRFVDRVTEFLKFVANLSVDLVVAVFAFFPEIKKPLYVFAENDFRPMLSADVPHLEKEGAPLFLVFEALPMACVRKGLTRKTGKTASLLKKICLKRLSEPLLWIAVGTWIRLPVLLNP